MSDKNLKSLEKIIEYGNAQIISMLESIVIVNKRVDIVNARIYTVNDRIDSLKANISMQIKNPEDN